MLMSVMVHTVSNSVFSRLLSRENDLFSHLLYIVSVIVDVTAMNHRDEIQQYETVGTVRE